MDCLNKRFVALALFLLGLQSVAGAESNSFTIPAWAFDRGSVRTFTKEYADAGPMIAFGGQSPVVVEYDIPFPAAGAYRLRVRYAAASARPVELELDGTNVATICRTETGSWSTSGAKWESSAELSLVAGRHTLRLQRAGDFPHVVSLRFDSAEIPADFVMKRPKARKLTDPPRALVLFKPSVPEVKPEAVRLAIHDLMATHGARYPNGAGFLHRLSGIEAQFTSTNTATLAQAQSDLRVLQREALLANPLLDFDKVVLLRRGFPDTNAALVAMGGALGVGTLNAHTSDDTPRAGHWNDELAVLSNLRGEPQFAALYRPNTNETIIDPVLHFDADRLLFAKAGVKEKNWRLFELILQDAFAATNAASPSPLNGERIGVRGEADQLRSISPTHGRLLTPALSSTEEERERGAAKSPPRSQPPRVRQITPDDGVDVAHFDPCYLPDGRIIFASTAVYQGLPCEFGAQAMTCLYLFDPKAQTIRQLTFEQDSDWCPSMLPNGRVLYQRWEYTDQSHSNSRLLFHMNPDGTDQREFRGSGSWFPGSFFYARAIPGEPHQVIGIATGHHGTPRSGRLLILDPSQGRRDGEGIVQEIPGRGKKVEPIVRDRLVDGVWPQFLMPWPLSANYHLVAAKLRPDSLWGIYLADVFDNLTLIKEVEGEALLWPIAMQKTAAPPVIPDRVNLASDESTVFITDIYQGPGLQGVPRGTVKNLRVIEYYFSRRGFGGLYGTLGADGPWDVKRILGTVPVESDGSAHFKVPANSPLALQPIDEKGQALQLMRSWFVGMPGEAVSCSGCHEPQNEVSFNKAALASRKLPADIEPWHGPARGFSFVREVQPVLDRHCVSCHDGADAEAASQRLARQTQAGSLRHLPDFRGGLLLTNWSTQLAGHWGGGGKFTAAYWELQRWIRRPGIEGDRRMFTPLDFHFNTTELGQMLRKGHHGVQLDAEGFERLAAWFDLNAPFYGTWGEIPQFSKDCQDPAGPERLARVNARAMELRRKYVSMGPHPDYEVIPDAPKYDATPVVPAAIPNLKSQISNAGIPGWPFDAAAAVAKQKSAAADGQLTRAFDLGDGVTLELVRIPGGKFAMGSTNGAPAEAPRVAVEVRSFWMAKFETANRQFRQFNPSHESRTEDRHGYQFGRVGYDQDQPDQPAVRVSWEEAMAFCRWLSQKTGLKISLPTEAQWEWACRAGSATPFWFGELEADYSTFANLGDQRLREFAADTALDNYAAARPMVNPNSFDDWIPRDDRFNDGGFVTAPVGKYKPNPWGLHDMHGNAWEWTRSLSRAYPYRDDDGRNDASVRAGERVARGGSWFDRPKRGTASYRLSYPAWQRVYNVGFRVVCEQASVATAQHSLAPRPSQ